MTAVTPMPTERERMLAGEYYDSRDPELLALARRARALLARFNAGAAVDGHPCRVQHAL